MSLSADPKLPRVGKCHAACVPILLVDDDPDCRQLVRDGIEQSAHGQLTNPIYEVSSGEEAMAFLQREGHHAGAPTPGLIYMDVEMPGMGGLETLRAIRADKRFADTVVVLLTGVTDDGFKRRAMQLGVNSYTNKPADAAEFIRRVVQTTEYWLLIHQHPTRANS